MTALVFDTYKAVKVLRDAGADEAVAEAVVTMVGNAVSETVATKADLAEVGTEIGGVRTEIGEVKAELILVKSVLDSGITQVRTGSGSDIAKVETDLSALGDRLSRHLWVIAASIVGLTVAFTIAFTVTLVKLTS